VRATPPKRWKSEFSSDSDSPPEDPRKSGMFWKPTWEPLSAKKKRRSLAKRVLPPRKAKCAGGKVTQAVPGSDEGMHNYVRN